METSEERRRREEEEQRAREKAERAKRERLCPECSKRVSPSSTTHASQFVNKALIQVLIKLAD